MWLLRKRKKLGPAGEDIAAKALRKAGYKILERNVRLGKYEIDIIARDGDTTAFVEVKTRRDGSYVPPEDCVGGVKRQHIRKAARLYISRHDEPDTYYRFDVVSVVTPDSGKPQVTIHRDAFGPE
jgi:putative endonuclease